MKSRQEQEMIKQKAERSAEVAVANLPPSMLYAIQVTAATLKNGVFWGFVPISDVKKHMDDLRGEQNITLRKIDDGYCIVEVQPAWLLNGVVACAPDAFTTKDVQQIRYSADLASADIAKFLCKMGMQNDRSERKIVIYCVNKVPTVVMKGTALPAFRLTMGQAMQWLGELGYQVKVAGNYVPAKQAMGMGQALWDSLRIIPTKSGVAMDIKFAGNPEYCKQFDKEMRHKK